MSAQWLSGSTLAKQMKETLKTELALFRQTHHVTPTLAVIRVGHDEASAGYARAIEKNCQSVGINFRAESMSDDVSQQAVETRLQTLNKDTAVHGIMLLEPLPSQINANALVLLLNPSKDVDGVHPLNAGRLAAQRPPYFVPATPAGGLRLLESTNIDLVGKQAVIVGRSDIVGKPMAMLLLHRHCTVTIAHSRTQDLPALCHSADILCVAVGRPAMVRGNWVKSGAVVIDFGTTYTVDGLKGDCDQESVAAVAGWLTPVPGGTGPMTNVMLLSNILQAAKLALVT